MSVRIQKDELELLHEHLQNTKKTRRALQHGAHVPDTKKLQKYLAGEEKFMKRMIRLIHSYKYISTEYYKLKKELRREQRRTTKR
jgi:hypothetical protein